MHIPDGVLSNEVCLATAAASATAVGYSLHKLKNSLADRVVPLTGMMSAFIFAGQMVNFPLLGAPVSGHLMGGVLAAIILGPWAGCVSLTLVLLVQTMLFSDGGKLALGANVLHMAVIGSLGGYFVYAGIRKLFRNQNAGTVVAAVIAAWLSVMAATALFCAEFQISWLNSDFNFGRIFALMTAFHSAIGIGEALITGVVVSFVIKQRPSFIYNPVSQPTLPARLGSGLVIGGVCALAIATFLAPFASEFPDGLEAVAERIGFSELATESSLAMLPDYQIPLPVKNWEEAPHWQRISVGLAGILGTVVVAGLAFCLGRLMLPRPSVPDVSHGK